MKKLTMKLAVLLGLSLGLAGCWTGPTFYAASEAVQPIPPGQYRVVHVEDPFHQEETPFNERVRISHLPDGRTNVKSYGEGDDSTAEIVKLKGSDTLYVVQMRTGDASFDTGLAIYGLLNVIPDGYQLALPPCDGTRRASPGSRVLLQGIIGRGKATPCKFKTRDEFETAMLKFSKDPIRWTEYRFRKK